MNRRGFCFGFLAATGTVIVAACEGKSFSPTAPDVPQAPPTPRPTALLVPPSVNRHKFEVEIGQLTNVLEAFQVAGLNPETLNGNFRDMRTGAPILGALVGKLNGQSANWRLDVSKPANGADRVWIPFCSAASTQTVQPGDRIGCFPDDGRIIQGACFG